MVGANVKTNFYIDDIYYTTITQGFLDLVFSYTHKPLPNKH